MMIALVEKFENRYGPHGIVAQKTDVKSSFLGDKFTDSWPTFNDILIYSGTN